MQSHATRLNTVKLCGKVMTISITLLSFACALTSCAQQPTKKKTTPKQLVSKKAPLSPQNTAYCPQVSELQKVNMKWSAPGGWGSNNPSFSSKILRFEGAQWRGIKNGKIICIYQGNGDDFPITLQTNRFIEQPWGKNWQKTTDKQGNNTVNCVADNPKSCPFPKVTEMDNPYAAPPITEDKTVKQTN